MSTYKELLEKKAALDAEIEALQASQIDQLTSSPPIKKPAF